MNALLSQPDFNGTALTGWSTLGVGGPLTNEFVDNLIINSPGDDFFITGGPAIDERIIVAANPTVRDMLA